MKTKIKKTKGWYRLMVDDAAINKAYECSQKDPIVLATIGNFFDSGCWDVTDFRITKYTEPNPYFEGSDLCSKYYKTQEEKDNITSRLHTYREKEEKGKKYIQWNTFDKALWDGDNPSCKDKSGTEYNVTARFTYKKALEKLSEIKQFWDNFEGTDLMSAKIENPHRQISDMVFIIEESIAEENKAKKMKVKK